jgi:hypothetical protein
LNGHKSDSKSRRSFVRKLLGLAAVGGAATLLFGGQVREVRAVSGTGVSGQVAYWTDASGTLASFPSVLNAGDGSIALGYGNYALGTDATVGGGFGNTASDSYATVGGGQSNSADGYSATVAGGADNFAEGNSSTVAGGYNNSAGGHGAFVGGGGTDGTVISGNVAAGNASTVGGGLSNVVSGSYATVGGGILNKASAYIATVGGGQSNTANGQGAMVGGGYSNAASNSYATVGGGYLNKLSGAYATVPGGFVNSAGAANSFAAGTYATIQSAHHGSMLFSDDTFALSGVAFSSLVPDEFAVRATGGFRFVTGIDSSGNVMNLASINASGSLGIRTGSPSYALDLQTSGSSSSQMHVTPTGTDSGGYLTSANPGNLFMSAGAAWNGSAWVAKSSTSYQYGGGVAGVRFFFDTGLTVGGTYTPTTRMFIGPTGHVGIGMSTAPAHLLQLGLDDAAKPSTSTWTIASDGRLKDPESIEPFTEGSDLIRRLPQPVWFRYRKDSGLPSDRRVAGWVAQDIAPIAPFMVRSTKQKLRETDREETETLSLNTNDLSYALVNFAKEVLEWREEMVTRIEAKEDDIAKLKAEFKVESAETKTRLERLEKAST